jgi:hypothetical protein
MKAQAKRSREALARRKTRKRKEALSYRRGLIRTFLKTLESYSKLSKPS